MLSPSNTAPRLPVARVRQSCGTSIVHPYGSVWVVHAVGTVSRGREPRSLRNVVARRSPAAANTRRPTTSPPARRRRERRRRAVARSWKLPGSAAPSERSNNSSRSSGIGNLQGGTQVGASVLRQPSNGRIRYTHHSAGLGRGVAEELGQDDRLASAQ